jgi:hypothetical protein
MEWIGSEQVGTSGSARSAVPQAFVLGGPLRPGNDVAFLHNADSGTAGLRREAIGNSGQQRLRLTQSEAETKNEHARISLVNAVYEFILLLRAEGVTDNRHLTVGRELHRTGQIAGLYRSISDLFQNKRPAFLEILIARDQQDCLHRLRRHDGMERAVIVTNGMLMRKQRLSGSAHFTLIKQAI